jgi:hypothetical protein
MAETASIPELPRASEAAAQLKGESPTDPIAPENPKEKRKYTFQFDYLDKRGKRWAGEFVNQILSIRGRQQQKVLKAQLSGNTVVSALDSDIWALNEIVSHMTISLIKRPAWAKELTDLDVDLDTFGEGESLIEKLYAEVASHEASFYGRGSDTDEDPPAAEDSAGGDPALAR